MHIVRVTKQCGTFLRRTLVLHIFNETSAC